MQRGRASRVWLGALIALAVLAWWLARPAPRPPALNRPVLESEPPAAFAPPPPRPAPGTRPRAPLEPATPRCVPAASERCVMGDVWLVDSCGNPEEKVEECAELGCGADACEPPPTEPCQEPPEGRCDGDVVRLCLAGRSRAIDCRAQGLRCGYGEEGAECRPEIPWRERCAGPARCEADVLVRCEDGRALRVDCQALRAKCLKLPGSQAPSCVAVKPLEPTAQDCGPCGCPPSERVETCDGRDEDGDGLVDQGVDCGPVPVLAFIVTGPNGQTSHAREDVEAELLAVNRSFQGSDDKPGLSFVLEDVIELSLPSLLELEREELDRLVNDPQIHPARETFYVPIVFTDSIVAGGGTPKPGISTLPNGMCGGMQQGRGPEVGVLAVAKARYATTVAHELGHFLGLCHTHDQQEVAPFVAVANAQTGALETCQKRCRGEGDGVCDTPYDPGPELCRYGADCRTACAVDAAPDPKNLMSYYAACRDLFSDEQRLLMQHTLALRRGWQRCLGFSCDCKLGDDSCPVGMSCRSGSTARGEAVARCALDGPRAPGADCQSTSDCGQGGLCLSESATRVQRCARPCLSSRPSCECTKVADDLSVCIQDIGRAR